AGARFCLMRSTLERLVSNLATPILAREGRAQLSRLSLEAIAARAAHLLLAEDALSYFSPIARRPGFARTITRTIEELRMNRVSLDSIRRLPRGGPDLAILAERIETELAEARLSDRAARFEAALQSVQGDRPPYPVGLPLLLLDLPITSGLEAALIAALSSRTSETIATVPYGDTQTIRHLE